MTLPDPALTAEDVTVRGQWVALLAGQGEGGFLENTASMTRLLAEEVAARGHVALLAHLRLCGVIPERFEHDSSAEKLYSKYTDAVLAETFRFLGMNSLVLAGRADCADVEAVSQPIGFDLVADAKAFRLSRTAKNAKDFKIGPMHRWKYGKRYGVVVAPIFQLPTTNSQIYEQAITFDVAVLSYSHLAVLLNYVGIARGDGQALLEAVLSVPGVANPSKSSFGYWSAINGALISFDRDAIEPLWSLEKQANLETIKHAKQEALAHLESERTRILQMTHAEAVATLIESKKLAAREAFIRQVNDNSLLSR